MTDDKRADGADVDPIIGASMKAAATAGEETGKLLSRVLGPSADQIGEALGRYTEFRMRNVGRIADKADKKSRGKPEGEVPPRLAHTLLEAGSYSDDELMAEYLSGVLAGGRTPNGRDDRAVVWSNIVTGMSTLQLRTHLILYREWAARLRGQDDLLLNSQLGRDQCEMIIDLAEVIPSVIRDLDVEAHRAMPHAVNGLVRLGLLGETFNMGGRHGGGKLTTSPYELSLRTFPTLLGVELYGWAQGVPSMTGTEFVAIAMSLAEDQVPRIFAVSLPQLPSAGASGAHEVGETS